MQRADVKSIGARSVLIKTYELGVIDPEVLKLLIRFSESLNFNLAFIF